MSDYPPVVCCFNPDDLETLVDSERPDAAPGPGGPGGESWHPENPLYDAFCARRKVLREEQYRSGGLLGEKGEAWWEVRRKTEPVFKEVPKTWTERSVRGVEETEH